MRSWRVVVALLAILIWGVMTPVAMASSGCAGMGAMCEGPCGASSAVVSGPPSAPVMHLTSPRGAEPTPCVPDNDPHVVEPPPK